MDCFRKFTPIRKIIGPALNHVGTSSVSQRYQTSSYAQLLKMFLENVNYDLLCTIFNIPKAPSKITRYGVQGSTVDMEFSGNCFELFRGMEWCEQSTKTTLDVQ